MPRYIDADALLESLKNFTYAEPCTEFQRGVNAVVPLILSEIKHFHLADVVQAPEKTCSTCQCNKVCDHNKYGFENCGNYISDDVALRAEVAEELTNMTLSKIQIMISAIKAQEENGIITEFNGGAKTALEIVSKDLAELKKKYPEDGK